MSRSASIAYATIARLLTMSIVWLVLLIWHLNAYRANCAVAAGVLAVLVLFLTMAGLERSLLMRRTLLEGCPTHAARVLHLFGGTGVMVVRELAVALPLALVLLVGALVFSPHQWSVLVIVALLLTLLIPRMAETMDAGVPAHYRDVAARRWAMWISMLLLWGEGLAMMIFSPPDDYIGMRWQQVITYRLAAPDVACPLLAAGADIVNSGQALAAWAVQNAARLSHDRTQAVMVWVGYGSLVGFGLLVALAYSRALVGVMARPWELRRDGPA